MLPSDRPKHTRPAASFVLTSSLTQRGNAVERDVLQARTRPRDRRDKGASFAALNPSILDGEDNDNDGCGSDDGDLPEATSSGTFSQLAEKEEALVVGNFLGSAHDMLERRGGVVSECNLRNMQRGDLRGTEEEDEGGGHHQGVVDRVRESRPRPHEATRDSTGQDSNSFPLTRGERSVPPASEGAQTTLVPQFDSSPVTYSAEDAGVRLHVRLGSMAVGQIAGPIVIQTDKRLLVECEGSWFLVSAVVDCQPSGSTFDIPLDLDFRVEEGLDEQSDDSEEANLDEYLDECKEIIRNTYKVRPALLRPVLIAPKHPF